VSNGSLAPGAGCLVFGGVDCSGLGFGVCGGIVCGACLFFGASEIGAVRLICPKPMYTQSVLRSSRYESLEYSVCYNIQYASLCLHPVSWLRYGVWVNSPLWGRDGSDGEVPLRLGLFFGKRIRSFRGKNRFFRLSAKNSLGSPCIALGFRYSLINVPAPSCMRGYCRSALLGRLGGGNVET
jgi:hypothetical protein